MKSIPRLIIWDDGHNSLRMRTVRNAVAVTKYRAAELKRLAARQRVIDKERRFLSSAAGRRGFPKYERAPEHLTQQAYIHRHQRRMMDFRGYDLRRAFRPKGKYFKSKTRYPKRPMMRIEAKPVYKRRFRQSESC